MNQKEGSCMKKFMSGNSRNNWSIVGGMLMVVFLFQMAGFAQVLQKAPINTEFLKAKKGTMESILVTGPPL